MIGQLWNGSHHFKEVGMGKGEDDQLADDFAQGFLGRQLGDIFQLLDKMREAFADQGDVKVFLALKINVERALADLCGGGDVVEADLVERFCREEPCGGVGDFSSFDFAGTLHWYSSNRQN